MASPAPAPAPVTDATRRGATRNVGDVNTHRRATLLCATPLTARVRSGPREGCFEDVSWRAREPIIDFFVRLLRHTTSFFLAIQRNTTVLSYFFSASRHENEFAIRAAALAARRSGARLAPVSPPAALPTILTRKTREKK